MKHKYWGAYWHVNRQDHHCGEESLQSKRTEELDLGTALRAMGLPELIDMDLLNWFFQHSLSAWTPGIFFVA